MYLLGDGIREANVLILLLLGILIDLLLSSLFARSRYIRLFSNILPFIFIFTALLFYEQDSISVLTPFLWIFLLYSIANALGQEIMLAPNPWVRSVSFMIVQVNKILAIFVNTLLIDSRFSPDLMFRLSVSNAAYENSFPFIYLVTNLVIITFGFFIAMLQLLLRNARLSIFAEQLKNLSSWSLDSEVIEQSLADGEMSLSHQRRTILIGDIRGFSAFSERNHVKEVIRLLEGLYSIIEETVESYEGFKPEFIADEFITFFQNNRRGVKCAMELTRKVTEYLGEFNLAMGMGMDRGVVLEGIVGSRNSRKYTIMGRSVNVASRLESHTNGGEVLASARVVSDLKDIEKERLQHISLKGVKRKITVYKLIEFKPSKAGGLLGKITKKVRTLTR